MQNVANSCALAHAYNYAKNTIIYGYFADKFVGDYKFSVRKGNEAK